MFWNRVRPAPSPAPVVAQPAALASDAAAGRGTPIPDRDTVVANVRARRAAHQEQ